MAQATIDHIFSTDFDRTEFKQRRQRVAEAIGTQASALFQGAPRPPSPHPVFAQSKVFYYMCGLQIERCYLLIDGASAKTTLFVPQEGISNVTGGTLDDAAKTEICSRMGIDEVVSTDALEPSLKPVSTLYLLQRPDEVIFGTKFGLMGAANLRAADPFDGLRRRDQLLLDTIKAIFPRIEIADLEPIISKMRTIKSPAEIEVLRQNGKMSAKVCSESMKSTTPGMPVGVYNGIADYVFRVTGDCGHAYDFILEPSHAESETMLDGDLVLLDCAPDRNCYAMDIARMWPVNGVFDSWQRHTYGVIVDYHKILLDMARPGHRVADIYEQSAAAMLEKYAGDEAGLAILNNMIAKGVRYYNHHVGLAPHDAVDMTWRDEPLKPGMVLAVDPMVWLDNVPHGYVRVEDTIVITQDGCEVLTGSVPFEIEAIESLMKQPGQFPVNLSL